MNPVIGQPLEKNMWPYRLMLPLMWLLVWWAMAKKKICMKFLGKPPKVNTMWFDGRLSPNAAKVKQSAGTWRAQDLVYNYFVRSFHTLLDHVWFGCVNAQASRNRLRIVTKEMIALAMRLAESGEEVRILSVACGSAEAVVATLVHLKDAGYPAKALLTDIDDSALEYAQTLANDNGVGGMVTCAKTIAIKAYRSHKDFNPNIVEMVGLMDYLDHKEAVAIVKQLHRCLEQTCGYFITANVHDNPEREFLVWVIDWVMIYRTREELLSVVREAGFGAYSIQYEPVGINGIVIAKW
jgi:hypothetical protein